MSEPDCSNALRELYEFLDGELDETRRRTIEEHLDLCGPCLDHHDFERDLRTVVAASCVEEVPEDLRARISQAIEAAEAD